MFEDKWRQDKWSDFKRNQDDDHVNKNIDQPFFTNIHSFKNTIFPNL